MAPVASCVCGKKGKSAIESGFMVQCDKCRRWDFFENCQLGTVFDREAVELMDYVCRMCKLESKSDMQEVKIAGLKAEIEKLRNDLDQKTMLQEVKENLFLRVEKVEKKHTELETSLSDLIAEKVKRSFAEVVKVGKHEESDGPQTKGSNSVSKARMSFSEKYREKDNQTVVMFGDSMLRGVGQKLERNSQMFSIKSVGGARIENITEILKETSIREDSHVVAVVGTNNLGSDGTEIIRSKYREMLKMLSEVKCKKVSVVGIFRRAKDDGYTESKRLAVNVCLSELCGEFKVEYIDPEVIYRAVSGSGPVQPTRTQMLDRGGLHLNDWGQEKVAAFIFKHCVSFLG